MRESHSVATSVWAWPPRYVGFVGKKEVGSESASMGANEFREISHPSTLLTADNFSFTHRSPVGFALTVLN